MASTQSSEPYMRVNFSTSMGVWDTTFKSCLWLQTSCSSGAMLKSPTAIIFYACQVGERAYEDPKLEHGVFTYYILSGIRDLASQPDGQVEAGHLASYLRENVKRWTAEYQARAPRPTGGLSRQYA